LEAERQAKEKATRRAAEEQKLEARRAQVRERIARQVRVDWWFYVLRWALDDGRMHMLS
jgi:hypothetical protein